MKVRAKKLGYYDHKRRREGDVFTLKPYKTVDGKVVGVEQQFSKLWMEKVEGKAAKAEKPVEEPVKDEASDEVI